MTELKKWRLRAMGSICWGYLDSYYHSLCLEAGEERKFNLSLQALAKEVARIYDNLNLNNK